MRVFLAFLVGFVISYLAIVAGGILYMDVAGIVDRDGGGTMGLAFTLGPLGALIGGTAAALTAAHYRRRRQKPADATASRARPASHPRRIVLAALIAGAATFLVAAFAVWLQTGVIYTSYWTAFLIVWSPYILGLCAAALAAWLASRSPPSP